MLIFKKVRWKNFLSTGNAFTEIDLNANQKTIIFGKNGSGKSTFLDAITFGLFGKAFRNINKPALVNTINDKNCVVELEFSVGDVDYKVIRGIKPAIFEIYKSEELLNKDAASKDYQKVLEQQILKFNYRTFSQVVVLGSANYVPFMELPLAARRDVIEELLDIKIFSIMNQLLKEESAKSKEILLATTNKLNMLKTKIESQKELIEVIKDNVTQKNSDLTHQIEALQSERESNILDIQNLQSQYPLQDKLEELEQKQNNIESAIDEVKRSMSSISKEVDINNKQIKFIQNNSICSTCKQDITEDHRACIVSEKTEGNMELQEHYKSLESILSDNMVSLKNIKESISSAEAIRSKIQQLMKTNKQINQKIEVLKDNLNNNTDERLTVEKIKLKDMAVLGNSLVEEKKSVSESKHVQEICSLLLKDSGIKSTIIKEYLPIFNKLINTYLEIMELYVDFQLDETFNESMKARYRDTFSYASFSEGEKQRIDIALLFTFREIAKMKNSLSTNLLIMDEVFDSSLDVSGVDYVMNLINQLDKTNTFIISHNINLISSDIFDHSVMFDKHNGFSVVSNNSRRYTS